MLELSETVVGLSDAAHAQVIYELLSPFAGRVALGGPPPSACLGFASQYLGKLAHSLGRLDEALAHFEDAIRLAAAMEARPFRADAQVGAAMVLRDLGRTDDADALLATARVTAEDLGMIPLAAKIAAATA
jgi:tetratricopeptide (TPR) repeat protein